jgi:hypothetical protein
LADRAEIQSELRKISDVFAYRAIGVMKATATIGPDVFVPEPEIFASA